MRKGPGKILGEALRTFGKKPATTTYPFTKIDISDNYRGKLKFVPENCIGCNLCVKDCPSNAIAIENTGTKEEKKFIAVLNLDRCIFCGQCVDSCRKNALSMSNYIELADLDRKNLKQNI